MFRKLIILAAASLLCTLVSACVSVESRAPLLANNSEPRKQTESTVMATVPVFGQLVSFPLPTGFAPAFKGLKNQDFILEFVPTGESAVVWTQMVTLTGLDGFTARHPNVTPTQVSDVMSNNFKHWCPSSYARLELGPAKFDDHDGFAAVMSCGVANLVGKPYSESTLVIVLKGERNYYTVQWAERGAGSKTPLKLDRAKWEDRFKQLMPIKLHPLIPGETSPDPACVSPGANAPSKPSQPGRLSRAKGDAQHFQDHHA